MNIQDNAYHTQTNTDAYNVYGGNTLSDNSVDHQAEAQSVASIYIKDRITPGFVSQASHVLAEQVGVITAERTDNAPGLLAVRFDPKLTRGNRILRELRELDSEHTCIALMHFKGSDTAEFETQVVRAVISQSGVIAAERSAHKACVFMVHFDPSYSTGSQIVRALKQDGYTALLVGC
jgi:hypothetical protein